MKVRKSRLYMAVASSIAAASLVPSLSWGFSIDVVNGDVLTTSAGDTLVYPLYTTGTDGSTATSFSLSNTSPDTVVVTKIRFREQTHSMDAMDFMIVLSPNDKFDWTVSKGEGDPRPKMTWKDNSCIVGPGQGTQSYMFPITNQDGKNNNSYVYDETALDAGHIEVLGLAGFKSNQACYNATNKVAHGGPCNQAGDVDLYTAATHVNGTPANCAAVTAVLKSSTLTKTLHDLQVGAVLDAPDSLVGRYVVTVGGMGIEGGGDAMAIKGSDLKLSSQSQAMCNDSGNCVDGYVWDQRDYDHPHLGDMEGARLQNFQDGLMAMNVAGDWSNNPANNVGVDWVMSFPTKYLYTDLLRVAGSTDPILPVLDANKKPTWLFADTKSIGVGYAGLYPNDGCLTADVAAWGREEESGVSAEIVSPSPSATLEFCNETNILTFQVNDQALRPTYIGTQDANGVSRRTIVPFTVTGSTPVRGWSMMNIGWMGNVGEGDSISGVVFTTRDTDNAAINNGSITEIQKGVEPHTIN